MADRGEQVVVVGAGIVGACVFHELVRRGHDATLVDRGRAGGGTTAVSGGIVRCFHDDPVLVDRAVTGWRCFRRLAGSTPGVLRAECGFLHLPRRDRAAWSRRQALRLAGWTSVEWLAPGALRERFGHLLVDADAGAVHETRALRLDPAVTVQALVDGVLAQRRHDLFARRGQRALRDVLADKVDRRDQRLGLDRKQSGRPGEGVAVGLGVDLDRPIVANLGVEHIGAGTEVHDVQHGDVLAQLLV